MSSDTVVRLPTAARRKVRQPSYPERRALAGHLDECPAEYMAPWVRKLLRDREALQGTAIESARDSAALLIVTALLANADPVLKAKVYGQVAYFNQIYETPETYKAMLIVEPMLNPFQRAPGAA